MKMAATLAAGLVLAGCSFPTSDPQAEALANAAFEQLRTGDFNSLATEISPKDFGPNPTPVLQRMHDLLPAGDPQPGKLVGFNSYAGTGGSTLTLNYNYDYPDAVVTSSLMLAKDASKPKGWIIRGFHINLNATPSTANAPTDGAPRGSAPAPNAPKPAPPPSVKPSHKAQVA